MKTDDDKSDRVASGSPVKFLKGLTVRNYHSLVPTHYSIAIRRYSVEDSPKLKNYEVL